LYVRNDATAHEWRSTYYPRVDEFSMLEAFNSSDPFYLLNPNVTIWIEFFNVTTPTRKHVYSLENDVVVTYYTAVVHMSDGVVSKDGIKWDEGCGDCKDPTKYCLDWQCGVDRSSLGDCSQTDCNIKVYFAWSGTDKDHTSCASVNSIPSAFKHYSLTPAANFGTGLWDDFLYRVKATGEIQADNAGVQT